MVEFKIVFHPMCGSFSFSPGVFLSYLHSQKALPLAVWNDSCHNYSQVNTGRRRGMRTNRKKEEGGREGGSQSLVAAWRGVCEKWKRLKVGQQQPASSKSGKGVRRHGSWAHARKLKYSRGRLLREARRLLTNWSGALLIRCYTWASSCDLRGPHVSSLTPKVMQAIAESPAAGALPIVTPQAADNSARSRLLSDLSNVFPQQMSSPSSTTFLACNWSDGGNRFGLHALVFQCAGQTSLISPEDSCGKCPTRLPVIHLGICSRPSVNIWIQLTCCETVVQTSVKNRDLTQK